MRMHGQRHASTRRTPALPELLALGAPHHAAVAAAAALAQRLGRLAWAARLCACCLLLLDVIVDVALSWLGYKQWLALTDLRMRRGRGVVRPYCRSDRRRRRRGEAWHAGDAAPAGVSERRATLCQQQQRW
jgi:hypothetical protein